MGLLGVSEFTNECSLTSWGGGMRRLNLGDVYFRVTYSDRGRAYPEIETFVYLGVDLSDEDSESTWYFQPARDFALNGSAISESAKYRPVVCVAKDSLLDMLNLSELFEVLEVSDRRRRAALG